LAQTESNKIVVLFVDCVVRRDEAEAELQFRRIREEQEYWQQELINLEALGNNTEAAWESFMSHLKELDRYFYFGYDISLEQKKGILNLLLEEFILYNDGKIELRFKLPVDEKQVANTIATLSIGDKSSCE